MCNSLHFAQRNGETGFAANLCQSSNRLLHDWVADSRVASPADPHPAGRALLHDQVAPLGRHHALDRYAAFRTDDPAAVIAGAAQPVDGIHNRPMHHVVGAELQHAQARPAACAGNGPNRRSAAPYAPGARNYGTLYLTHDRRQHACAARCGGHAVAHRALWLPAGGFSNLEQQSFLAVDPLDLFGECLKRPPLGLAADLVDDLEQQMTGPFLHKKDQCANLTLTNRVTRPAWHIQSEPTYVRRIRFSKRP
jgi:hypothetical protein